MLTAEENKDYWSMFSDYSEEHEDYYKVQYARLREKMNCKNFKIWNDYKHNNTYTDHYFGNYKYEATQWHEKMLTKMHMTISLEGRPDTRVTQVQSDSGSK